MYNKNDYYYNIYNDNDYYYYHYYYYYYYYLSIHLFNLSVYLFIYFSIYLFTYLFCIYFNDSRTQGASFFIFCLTLSVHASKVFSSIITHHF